MTTVEWVRKRGGHGGRTREEDPNPVLNPSLGHADRIGAKKEGQ